MAYTASISLLTIVIDDIQISPIASGFAMSISWILNTLLTNGFAWIHDAEKNGSYQGSFVLMVIASFVSLAISGFLFWMKWKQNL